VKDIVLLDVLPLSLGSRRVAACSPRSSNATRRFRCARADVYDVVDNQSSVEIHVLQGEREVAQGNRSLGKFELVGFRRTRAACRRSRFRLKSMRTASCQFRRRTRRRARAADAHHADVGPDAGEIDRLIHEAEILRKRQDTKEMLVLRTKLDSLLKNTQKSFTKFGGLLPEIDQDARRSLSRGRGASSQTS
jgi:molecular chaperone DnaK